MTPVSVLRWVRVRTADGNAAAAAQQSACSRTRDDQTARSGGVQSGHPRHLAVQWTGQAARRIEFNCNLAYADMSDPQAVDKTAEEIREQQFLRWVMPCRELCRAHSSI